MAFFQDPPRLANAYLADPLLRELLARALPDALAEIEPELDAPRRARRRAAVRAAARGARRSSRASCTWDAWGRRVDRIELTPLWKRGRRARRPARARRDGVRAHATARSRACTSSRSCYLLDAVARRLRLPARDDRRRGADARSTPATRRSSSARVPRLTAPRSGTRVDERPVDDGAHRRLGRVAGPRPSRGATATGWRLHGTKWFSLRDDRRRWRSRSRGPRATRRARAGSRSSTSRRATRTARRTAILVNRLKDKLGTRKLPTAELTLDGAPRGPGRRAHRTASARSRRCST